MDFRFQSALRDFLVSLGLKDNYDLVCLGGVTKDLVDNDKAGTEVLLKQITTSRKLHNIKEVYIIHHMDCGGYGGHSAFNNIEEERARQLADLETARKVIAEKFFNLEIKRVLARIGDKSNIDFEMIS